MLIAGHDIHLWFFWAFGLTAMALGWLRARATGRSTANYPYVSQFSDGVLFGFVAITAPGCIVSLATNQEITIVIGGSDAAVLLIAAIRGGWWIIRRVMSPGQHL